MWWSNPVLTITNMIEEINLHNYDYLVNERKVKEFVHFTSISNLINICKKGIITRHQLDNDKVDFDFNDKDRFDGKDRINLSITNPNINLFYKFRKQYPNKTYIVLAIVPEILKDLHNKDCYFTSTNAASAAVQEAIVEELFSGEREGLPSDCTTDNQSEFVIKKNISSKYITKVYVKDENDKNQVNQILKDNNFYIKVEVNEDKYKYDSSLLGHKNSMT